MVCRKRCTRVPQWHTSRRRVNQLSEGEPSDPLLPNGRRVRVEDNLGRDRLSRLNSDNAEGLRANTPTRHSCTADIECCDPRTSMYGAMSMSGLQMGPASAPASSLRAGLLQKSAAGAAARPTQTSSAGEIMRAARQTIAPLMVLGCDCLWCHRSGIFRTFTPPSSRLTIATGCSSRFRSA